MLFFDEYSNECIASNELCFYCFKYQIYMNYNYRYIQKYFIISVLFLVLLYFFLILLFNIILPTADVIVIQVISLFFFVNTFLLGIRLKIRDIFIVIFLFQLILSISLFVSHSFEYNSDYFSYTAIATKGINMNAGDFIKYIYANYPDLNDVSDLGYPFVLRFVYQIAGNQIYGDFLMCLLNVFLVLPTLYFVWKLSSGLFSKEEAKISVLFWGLNLYSVWTNASGMKETVFVLVSTGASYYLYKYLTVRSFKKLLWCILFIIGTFFFRNYITIFFVIIFVSARFFRKTYEKHFVFILISSLIAIFGATSLLSYLVPDVVAILAQRDSLLANTGFSGNLFNVISAFIAPYPAIGGLNQNVNLLIIVFVAFKVFFSIWGIIGIIYIIKLKQTQAYPIVNILYFNILLTIIAGFSLNYRYMHVTMPLYFIFMVHGFYSMSREKSKYIIIPYFILVTIFIVLYNLRSVSI